MNTSDMVHLDCRVEKKLLIMACCWAGSGGSASLQWDVMFAQVGVY